MRPKWIVLLFVWGALFSALHAQSGKRAADADWPMYNRDLAGTRYSPLKQINTGNVSKLMQVWSYRYREEGKKLVAPSPTEIFQQVTPIVVGGVMYLPAGDRVVALEPETGKEIWRYELKTGLASFRGLAYWPGDRDHAPRVLFTSLRKLIALNAKTGKIDPGFGKEGEVALAVPYAGVPTIYQDIILMGTNFFGPGERHIAPQLTTSVGELGDTSAYDAKTGKKLWDFHTIARPGEIGNDTWGDDSWKDRTGNNVWAFTLTVDEERGIVYLPVSGAGANFYGGDRPGNNLFGNSTVAVDARTGKLKWYFQTFHHELWDYNLPPAPSLFDIVRDGKRIPAAVQVGKSGFMYILNRVTGEPIYPIEERPVAQGNVPGEWYSPTQPIPVKPPPIARVSFGPEDLVTAEDTTSDHARACRELWDKNKFFNGGPYTPFLYKEENAAPSLIFPGLTGGANWGGTAFDKDSGYIFVNTHDTPMTGWIQKNEKSTPDNIANEFPYIRVSGPPFSAQAKDENGYSIGTFPCHKPPWARLIAVDAGTGDIAWQVPLGINESLPEGKQRVGSPGYGGPIVTAGGLLFVGATGDARFRAFESKTGKELWTVKLNYNVTAVPITYQGKNGKQYVAVTAATGRGGNNESLVVFALP